MGGTGLGGRLARGWGLIRRHKLAALIAVASVVVVWIAVSAWETVRGVEEARAGIAEIHVAKGLARGDGIERGSSLAALTMAETDFRTASRHLNWPLLVPFHFIPVLGRQLESVSALAAAAHEASVVGLNDARALRTIIPQVHRIGEARVLALSQIASLASTSYDTLSNLNLGPTTGLLASIASKHNELAGDLSTLESTLYHVHGAASAGVSLLGGPSRYVVLAANNAQMHDGSGAFLEVGTMTGYRGSVSVGSFSPTPLFNVPPGVKLTGDIARNWAFLRPNREFENLNFTPQFDVSASIAARMWTLATGQRVDGVMSIDMAAVQDLLSATGPISVNGTSFSSSNVLNYLMHDQYLGLTDSAAQIQRRDRLGSIAVATVKALQQRSISFTALASALSRASAARHLMMWSNDPRIERDWSIAGVEGSPRSNDLAVAVANRGGNKLDPYLYVHSALRLIPGATETHAVLKVTLENSTPLGEPLYIGGPYPGIGTVYGEYRGYVVVNLPGDVSDAVIHGYRTLVAAGPEGPTLLLAAKIDVLRATSKSVTVTFTLPGTSGHLDLMPSARVPPMTWSVGDHQYSDIVSRAVNW